MAAASFFPSECWVSCRAKQSYIFIPLSCVLGHNAPESRVEQVKHRREGDGQTGVQRLHQQRRDRIVQVGAQRPGRHLPGGGRGAVGQGDNDGIIIIYFIHLHSSFRKVMRSVLLRWIPWRRIIFNSWPLKC